MNIFLLLALTYSSLASSSSDDILVRPFCRNIRTKFDHVKAISRNVRTKDHLWKDGKIYYELASYFTQKEKNMVREAIQGIEKGTCIKWIERKNRETPFVKISADEQGCFADLGLTQGRTEYVLNLQRNDGKSTCWWVSIIQHEMFHIMGIDHEQNRPDRDDHITVKWQNIARNLIYNFFKDRAPKSQLPYCNGGMQTFDHCTSTYTTETHGVAYDYQSIMHYSGTAFTNNGQPTMVAKDSNEPLNRNYHITTLDYQKVNAAYCSGTKPVEKTTTKKPTDPNCKDIHSQCHRFSYICKDYPTWARNYCKKFCNFC